MSAATVSYANCPRCRLSIRFNAVDYPPTHCPRCRRRRREAVELFVSAAPFRLLTGAKETGTVPAS